MDKSMDATELLNTLLPQIGPRIAVEVDMELARALPHGRRFASLHEAWAVIEEEQDEVWDIVRLKKRDRDPEALRKELVQLAAMAIKALQSMENFTGGTV